MVDRKVSFRNAVQTQVTFLHSFRGLEKNGGTKRATHALRSHVERLCHLMKLSAKGSVQIHDPVSPSDFLWTPVLMLIFFVLPRCAYNTSKRWCTHENLGYCFWQLYNTYYVPAPISRYMNAKAFNPQDKYMHDMLLLPPLYKCLSKRIKAQCYASNPTGREWPFQYELLVCL